VLAFLDYFQNPKFELTVFHKIAKKDKQIEQFFPKTKPVVKYELINTIQW
jgi:hypothetical protein